MVKSCGFLKIMWVSKNYAGFLLFMRVFYKSCGYHSYVQFTGAHKFSVFYGATGFFINTFMQKERALRL